MRPPWAVTCAVVLAAAIGCGNAGSLHAAPPPGDTCPPVKPGSVAIDYVDFVQAFGRQYIAHLRPSVGTVKRGDLGRTVLTSRCSFSALNDRTGRAPSTTRDGDTGFLVPGTPVHAINGWDVHCRLAAAHDGQLNVYLAYRHGGRVATPRACALRRAT
jgi:hypothetical protein